MKEEKITEKEEYRIFSDDIKINRFKLDEECTNHSNKYYHWSTKLAVAKNKLAEEEDALDLIESQQELEIRKNWNDENGKQTEGSIKAVLASNKEVRKQVERTIEAKNEVNILQAGVIAMEHRKGMLDNLVTLFIRNFYSSPTGKNDISDQTGREVKSRLNSSRKEKN